MAQSLSLSSPSSKSKCTNCQDLIKEIRQHLKAFEILASINSELTWRVLQENVEIVLQKYDEDNKEERLSEVSVNIKTSPTPPPPEDISIKLENSLTTSFEEINQAQEETKIIKVEPNLEKPIPPCTNPTLKEDKTEEIPKLTKNKMTRGVWKSGWQLKCQNLLDELWSRDDALMFRDPVTCSDYRQLIDNPMCLSEIRQNLYQEKYDEPLKFHTDMMLIFHNSRIYNTKINSTVRQMTQSLENYYESHKLLQEILQKSSTAPIQSTPHPDLEIVESDQSSSIPSVVNPSKDMNFYKISSTPKLERLSSQKRSDKETKSRKGHSSSIQYNVLTSVSIKEADESLASQVVGGLHRFNCTLCKNITPRNRYEARLHVRRVHFNERYKCLQCSSMFYSSHEVNQHCKTTHGRIDKNAWWNLHPQFQKKVSILKKHPYKIQMQSQENPKFENLVELDSKIKVELEDPIIIRNSLLKFNMERAMSVKVKLTRLSKATLDRLSKGKFSNSKEENEHFFKGDNKNVNSLTDSILNPSIQIKVEGGENKNKKGRPSFKNIVKSNENGSKIKYNRHNHLSNGNKLKKKIELTDMSRKFKNKSNKIQNCTLNKIKNIENSRSIQPGVFRRIPIVFQMKGTTLEDVVAECSKRRRKMIKNRMNKRKERQLDRLESNKKIEIVREIQECLLTSSSSDRSSDEDYTPIVSSSYKKKKRSGGPPKPSFQPPPKVKVKVDSPSKNRLSRSGWTTQEVWKQIQTKKMIEKADGKPDKSVMTYSCLLCGAILTYRYSVNRHFYLVHPRSNKCNN